MESKPNIDNISSTSSASPPSSEALEPPSLDDQRQKLLKELQRLEKHLDSWENFEYEILDHPNLSLAGRTSLLQKTVSCIKTLDNKILATQFELTHL